LVAKGTHLRVIGRVEIQQREALNLGGYVEDICMDRVDTCVLSLPCAFCIEFHGVAIRIGVIGELEKRSASSGTWVQHGYGIRRVVEKLPETRSLVGRKRVVTEFDASDIAHGISLKANSGTDDDVCFEP